MRIATWNVNSLRIRLLHLLDWLASQQPDVMCLQETKTEDRNFPLAEIQAAGYQAVFCGQKGYNGVAILARTALTDVQHGIPDFADDPKRVIAASVGDIRVLCLYAPNGEAPGTEKYAYKLRWYEALTAWLGRELGRRPRLAVLCVDEVDQLVRPARDHPLPGEEALLAAAVAELPLGAAGVVGPVMLVDLDEVRRELRRGAAQPRPGLLHRAGRLGEAVRHPERGDLGAGEPSDGGVEVAERHVLAAVIEGRDLDEEEREITLAEALAPVGDHGGEELAVLGRAADVRLALVPDRALNLERNQRRNHAVVELGGFPGRPARALGSERFPGLLRFGFSFLPLRERRRTTASTGEQLEMRELVARIDCDLVDLRGQRDSRPDLYHPDDYTAGRAFGTGLRWPVSGQGENGLVYDSVRRSGGPVLSARTVSRMVATPAPASAAPGPNGVES